MNDELEEVDLFDVDETTKEVIRPVNSEPDANLAKQIKGSVSLIKAYEQCPAQAYGRITRQYQEKGVALVNGIAVHEALEKYIKDDVDPQAYYMRALQFEAEKNKVSLIGRDGDEAKKVGAECVGAAVGILNHQGKTGIPLKDRMDKDLVEKGFTIFRNGRKYVGKMDFVMFTGPEQYVIGDWKTGKNAPDPYELNTDLQFSMYAYAAMHDESMKTYGIWAERGVYMHLRGVSTEFDKNGKRVPKTRTKKPLQYDFPTNRTQVQVEEDFLTRIEPVMQDMEDGRWRRTKGKPCSWCSYFDKERVRCTVEIPQDALLPRVLDPEANPNLFGK